MSNESTYSGILGEWQRLEAALSANAGQIPHLRSGLRHRVLDLDGALRTAMTRRLLGRDAGILGGTP